MTLGQGQVKNEDGRLCSHQDGVLCFLASAQGTAGEWTTHVEDREAVFCPLESCFPFRFDVDFVPAQSSMGSPTNRKGKAKGE